MAFYLKNVGNFGYSDNFDLEISDGAMTNLNSYAAITEIDKNLITIDLANAFHGKFEFFTAGVEILIHASASDTLQADKLGNYIVAKITVADAGKLTLNIDIETQFKNSDLQDYHIQAITFARIHCLKLLEGGIISPPVYSPFTWLGGIVALKCDYALELRGGHIALNDCGIPVSWKDRIRPLTDIEIYGELDIDKTAGEENFQTKDKFLLNSGDGAAFIIAKKIVAYPENVSRETFLAPKSRIGNIKTHGKKNCRGASDSIFKPSNVTNVGGSSILIACKTFENFHPNLIAKYRTETQSLSDKGKGLARCYIASENLLPPDDKLYSADFVSRETFFSQNFNIFDFGGGIFGDVENPIFEINNSAEVLHQRGNKILIRENKKIGLANFEVGRKIFCQNVSRETFFAEIVGREGNYLTLDVEVPKNCRKIISVLECENFTLENDFEFENFVVAVKDKCKISGAIKNNCIILAKNLILASSAKLGKNLFCVAENISGFDENLIPQNNSYIFTNSKID